MNPINSGRNCIITKTWAIFFLPAISISWQWLFLSARHLQKVNYVFTPTLRYKISRNVISKHCLSIFPQKGQNSMHKTSYRTTFSPSFDFVNIKFFSNSTPSGIILFFRLVQVVFIVLFVVENFQSNPLSWDCSEKANRLEGFIKSLFLW